MNLYISKVFGWMFLGLILTASVSFVIFYTPFLDFLFNRAIIIGLLIGEFILVAVLSRRILKMSTSTAKLSFLFYAALNGITLSIILLIYTFQSIGFTFAITAVTFGIMSIYGRFTSTDLTKFSTILFMGLIGVIILSVVNIFFASNSLQWIISILGLFIFLGLTAYDTQKLKAYYLSTQGNIQLRNNLAILGALSLYLDFINLFLTLLRLFGRRR